MASFKGKVAVITGASRGIGRAIAERIGLEGAAVVVNYGKSANEAKQVVSRILANGGAAVEIQADVSKVSEIQRLFQQAIERFGKIDIVVSNAGTFGLKSVIDVTEEEYDNISVTNAKGSFFVLREAARRISDDGRIIQISTGATKMNLPGASLYLGSKSAAEQFARTLAKEVGARGITVNTVSPGFTDTDMLPSDPGFLAMAIQMSPLGRIGTPKDIADIVTFIASDEGRWVTGQTIQAGGGVVF